MRSVSSRTTCTSTVGGGGADTGGGEPRSPGTRPRASAATSTTRASDASTACTPRWAARRRADPRAPGSYPTELFFPRLRGEVVKAAARQQEASLQALYRGPCGGVRALVGTDRPEIGAAEHQRAGVEQVRAAVH